MIDVREAIKSAMEYVKDIYSGQRELTDLALEEVVLAEDESEWLVTVGFQAIGYRYESGGDRGGLFPTHGGWQRTPREYKVVQVDAHTGKIRSMRMREAS